MKEDGNLSFAMVLDTSQTEEELDKALGKFGDFTEEAIRKTSGLQEALSEIPSSVSVSLDVADAEQAMSISQQLDDIIAENQRALDQLDQQFRELASTIEEAEAAEAEAMRKSQTAREQESRAIAILREIQERAAQQRRDESQSVTEEARAEADAQERKRLAAEQAAESARREAEAQERTADASRKAAEAGKRQQEVMSKTTSERKRVITEAHKEQDALKKVVQQMSVEDRVAIALQGGLSAMKQLTRELQAEMVALEASGQRNTQRFNELAEGAAKLSDAMADARTQTNILSNDNAGFAGMISVMSGVSGGFTAVSGAMSLFGTQSEELQQVMLRVQSLMAITTGLQQVSTMLNKDSAASLVILNGVKAIWAKITKTNNAIAQEEAQTTAAATAAKVEEATATETETTAENENTAAVSANTTAKVENTQVIGGSTTAKGASAKATNAETAAMEGLTAATTKTTVATRILKTVLKTTVIFAVIGAVMWLISVIGDLLTKLNGTEKAIKAVNAAVDQGLEAYAKAKTEIEQYAAKLKSNIATEEEKKKLVDELNRKYGEQLGYHKSQSEWLDVLTQKGDDYCELLLRQAKAQALLNSYTDAYVRLLQLEEKQRQYNEKSKWQKFWSSSPASELKDTQEELKHLRKEWELANEDAQKFAESHDFTFHVDPSTVNTKSTFDPKKAAEQVFNAYKTYQDYVTKFSKQVNDEIAQANMQYMQDGLNKDLQQSRANFQRLIEEWQKQFNEYGQALKQRQHDIYMSNEGATEKGWRESDEGKKTDDDWLSDILTADKELYKQYYAHIERLQRESVLEQQKIMQKYTDSLIEQYGTTEEKIEQMERKFLQTFTNIPENDPLWKFFDSMERQLNEKIATMRLEDMKKSLNWEDVFGDMESVATPALEAVKRKLQEIVKTQKDLSPESVKTLVDAIKRIDTETNRRNPFKALQNSVTNLTKSTQKVKEAQEAYNEALQSGNERLIQSAEEQLISAQSARQKALADLTKSLQNASNKANELLEISTAIFSVFEQFGVEIPQELKGFAEGLGDAVRAIGEIDLTQPLSVIKGAVNVIGGFAKSISSLFNHDSRREKTIQKLQKQVEKLQQAYERLNKEIDKSYSKDASKLIEQQNQMLERQKMLILQQLREEEEKKKSDKDKIDEYKRKLQEIDQTIEENKLKAQDAIFGNDLKSAIEDFASAYANAWAQNENRTKSAKNVVRDMMRQMVQESIKAAIQSSAAMERIRQKLQEFYTDNILQEWEQQAIFKMAEDLQRELDEKFGWADSLMRDNNFQQGGSSGGFQAMSEDTGQELNGRFTAMQLAMEQTRSIAENIRFDTSQINNNVSIMRMGVEDLQNTSLLQLHQLELINTNTKRLNDTNELLERIERNTKNL